MVEEPVERTVSRSPTATWGKGPAVALVYASDRRCLRGQTSS